MSSMDLMRAPLEQIDAWTAEPGAVDVGARRLWLSEPVAFRGKYSQVRDESK